MMGAPGLSLTLLADPVPDEVAGFCCSDPQDLRDFLVDDAARYVRNRLARVYLGWEGSTLIGFFSLSCALVRFEELSKEVRSSSELHPAGDERAIPVVLLGRLATDERCRSQGKGTWLFDQAVSIAKFSVAPHVGCRFLALDANYERVEWYERRGCQVLGPVGIPPATTRMGFDLFPPT
jgi:GNAT superfamily N-acetyltransferase